MRFEVNYKMKMRLRSRRQHRLILAVEEQRKLVRIEEMERELREGSAGSMRSARGSPAPESGIGLGAARRAMAPPVFRGGAPSRSCGTSSKAAKFSSMQSKRLRRAGESP